MPSLEHEPCHADFSTISKIRPVPGQFSGVLGHYGDVAEPELRESWFGKSPVYSTPPPPSVAPPPPPPKRGPRFGLGVLVGGAGGAIGMEAAHLAAAQLGAADPLPVASAGGPSWMAFAIAALAGAPIGGMLAVVMMQGSRFITRAIFASIFSIAIWFCAHIAFVVRHHTPPPIVPMLICAAVFGVCVAFIPKAS